MNIPMIQVMRILEAWAANPDVTHFTTSDMLHATDLGKENHNEMFRYLLHLSRFFLIPCVKVICPNGKEVIFEGKEQEVNGEKKLTIQILPEGTVYTCSCREEHAFFGENAIFVFRFAPSFQEEAMEAKQK